MRIGTYIFIMICSVGIGILVFCIAQEWIILRFPHDQTDFITTAQRTQIVTLYRWHEGQWRTHTITLTASDNTQDYCTALVAAWLAMAQEEQMIAHTLSLQSALDTHHKDRLYLSFSDTLIQQNKSTMDNLICIESLLRTLRENAPSSIHSCVFLVNHAPMHDTHLDFSQPWPITGFLHKN
jgi:hypothetical protein